MGTWKPDSFGNDDALDWLGELQAAHDLDPLYQTFAGVVDGETYIEAPQCSAAIVAAEVVAAMKERPAPKLPPAVVEFIARNGRSLPPDLLALAIRSVDRIMNGSELQELWDESASSQEWHRALSDLRARLS